MTIRNPQLSRQVAPPAETEKWSIAGHQCQDGRHGGRDDDPHPTAARDILTAQLASCQRVDSNFSRGAAAALHWLTAGGPGPLTGATAAPIDFAGIVQELAAAEAIIYGPPSTGRDYARGVEHTLLWAEFATSGPPRSAEDRSRPSRRG